MYDQRDPLASMAQMFLMIADLVAPPGRERETREAALKILQDTAAGRPLRAPIPEPQHLPVRPVPQVQPTVYPFAEYQVTRDYTGRSSGGSNEET